MFAHVASCEGKQAMGGGNAACRTRQEFQEWVAQQAGPFPYSPSFHDIGKAVLTEQVLQKLPPHLQHADVGGSSQVSPSSSSPSYSLYVTAHFRAENSVVSSAFTEGFWLKQLFTFADDIEISVLNGCG